MSGKLSRGNEAISFPRQKIQIRVTSTTQKINYSNPIDFRKKSNCQINFELVQITQSNGTSAAI